MPRTQPSLRWPKSLIPSNQAEFESWCEEFNARYGNKHMVQVIDLKVRLMLMLPDILS